MLQSPKIFISHTTRDERDNSLAHKLAAGLQENGSDVWISPDTIPTGAEWRSEIISALLLDCTHFLVIISAAATMSEWVLAEIKLAKKRRESDASFTILPLIVSKTVDYDGKDFVDKFQQIPYQDNFSDLLIIVTKSLNLRPGIPNRYLKLTERFVGRNYVFAAIDDFISSNDHGYFTIVGDPGEGKSALISEYVKRTGCIAHFNLRAEGINRAEHFVKSISLQLSARFGLSFGSIPSNPAEFGLHLNDRLKQASIQLDQGDRLVIAIDALDEVDFFDGPPGVNLLYLPQYLPKGVYFILSSRRKNLPFVVRAPQKIFDLIHYREQSLEDIKSYIREAFARLNLENWISRQKGETTELINKLAEKSEYNFMYLFYVMPEIEKGAYQTLDVNKLPLGLFSYYEDHFDRMGMRTKPLPKDKLRIIYVIAEVRCPVSRTLISKLAIQDPVVVQQVIEEWKEFLHEQIVNKERRYSIYHTSFLDFLHDKEIIKATGETFTGLHEAIANTLWQELMENN
ncbi:MAG: toll/interleukin-1 receptor domain-containing protein [Calditrichaeota bacterium]|nr:MAG: toll/interleukin-1 receptor domain-containing protein [Calditrichota bacterium]